MKTLPFCPGEVTASDALYTAGRDRFEVYAADCATVTGKVSYRDPWCRAMALYAKDQKNVTFDFHGATLNLHGRLQPVFFDHCENVTLKNVNISYDRPLISEAKVLKIEGNTARVRFSDVTPCRVKDGGLFPYAPEWEDDDLDEKQMFFQFFDPETHDGIGISLGIVTSDTEKYKTLCFHPTRYVVEADGEDIVFHAPDEEKLPAAWQEGAILAIEHGGRAVSGILLDTCKNVRLENVRLVNTAGMGILPIHTENLYIDGLKLACDETSRTLITNTADAIHAFSCSGDFVIENSVIENCMDDALNVHGQFLVTEGTSGNILTAAIRSHGVMMYCNLLDVGDRVAIHRGNTTDLRGTAVVTGKTVTGDYTADFTLDSLPDGTALGDLVENISAQCDLTIRRTAVRRLNTHMRVQTSGKVTVENCILECPILLTGDATFWYECSPVRDLVVRGCAFTKERACLRAEPQVVVTEREPCYHKNVRVEGCTFLTDTPVVASETGNIVFSGNRNVLGKEMTLRLTNCGDASAPGCLIERKREEKIYRMN